MRENRLAVEASPYLRQHARNPVDWYPWGEEALSRAAAENKLLIISIGYAACHWCHVMEKECFESHEVARLMNDHFISIKVDREERPDLDRIYMDALQLLTGSGGWPLNMVALPDGRPLYGGTYFPRESWMSLLSRIVAYVGEDPRKAEGQADALTRAICKAEQSFESGKISFISQDDLDRIFNSIMDRCDMINGGLLGAPKFPMPSYLRFLLSRSWFSQRSMGADHLCHTLDKMAAGGIYDQIGGGFSRYSVDKRWKVPHFEKMLYDNAQLVSLYSMAFMKTSRSAYAAIVDETIAFLERELRSPDGAFYSSLDADSDDEEGKFYTWTEAELERIAGSEAGELKDYYSVAVGGNWEKGRNILHIAQDAAAPRGLERLKESLLAERAKRVRPALDDKIIASWNGLALTALCDAYKATEHLGYRDKARETGRFILENLIDQDGRLDRTFRRKGEVVNGFLDDYAYVVQAFISLYEITFDENWLLRADEVTAYALEHFSDETSPLLFYTSRKDPVLIARKKELIDNVIGSSNSRMAQNLYVLGHYFQRNEYIEKALDMVGAVRKYVLSDPLHFADWACLMALINEKPVEVAIVGEEYEALSRELSRNYLPQVILSGGASEGSLPLLKNKLKARETLIYVCRDRSCRNPVHSVKDALALIRG